MAEELRMRPTIQEAFEEAKKQGYPKYIPGEGDLICNVCGEPWDNWGVSHGDMNKRERRIFYEGKGCPSCLSKKVVKKK